MKFFKIFVVLITIFGVAEVSAKEPKTPKVYQTTVYAVGVATSFNDSLAYYTEMQELNNIVLDRKRYLHRRSGYSFQLRDYLLAQGKENYTCLILFNTKKAKLDKELAKVRTRFSKDNIKLIEIKEADFKFTKPEEL